MENKQKIEKQKRKIRNTILKHHKDERDETKEEEITTTEKEKLITTEKEKLEIQILKNELIFNLLFLTTDDIIKILIEMNFKGKIQKNKILMIEQLLKNFDTIEKMEKFNEKIKSCSKK